MIRHLVSKTIICTATLLVALAAGSWNTVHAQIYYGSKLGVNITGGNWTAEGSWWFLPKVDTMVNNIYNTGAQWVFTPVIWYTFEENAPTIGSCPYPNFGQDGSFMYYYSSLTNQCHQYNWWEVQTLDRLVGQVADDYYNGLKGNGHSVALGMYAAPKWASGASCESQGANGACAIVYRSYLPTLQNGAVDLATFLVTRYTPAAFSLWNEPNGFRYLAIEPDYTREFVYGGACDSASGSTTGCVTWPAWEDYYTYLLQPISAAVRTIPGVPAPLIIGPELATGGASYGRNAYDANWFINVGHWDIHWNNYLMSGGRADSIDKWSIHAYGPDWHWVPSSAAGSTWNTMVNNGAQKSIWATEVNMDPGANKREIDRANFFCQVNRTQPNELTFYFAAADGGMGSSDQNSSDGLGLMGSADYYYPTKWLITALNAILHGPPYYVCN
jgi:hypothetical protein